MKDIKLCHPKLQELAAKWQENCAAQGIFVAIGETLRTVAEQDALYAQGRTKPGAIVTNARGSSYSSQHQWGIAFDFYLQMDVNQNGKVSDDAYNDTTGLFGKAAAVAKSLGLGWGGDWKSIVDKPHLYLKDWGDTPTKLKETYGTLDDFRKTWAKQPEKPVLTEGWIRASDGVRWQYRHSDSTFLKGGWLWVENNKAWYLFDKDGYMLTGLQSDTSGQKFFLWPGRDADEGKCMVTDSRGVLMIVPEYDFEGHRYDL